MMFILHIILYLFLIYLGISTLYILVFSFAGLLPGKMKSKKASRQRKFAVLIPAYKEDEVIKEVAEDAIKQNYPSEKYDVVVIADSLRNDTLLELNELNLRVISVNFPESTKAKALNAAMDILTEDYDVAVVLDADNLMEADFLKKMNDAFEEGKLAVQGHRVAKNTNTNFAVLDAISEEINNHIFRKGHRKIGLSAAIIGSGMGIDYTYFRRIMKDIEAVGGFDKEIELKLLKDRHAIEYLNDAYVLDEKVQKADVFRNQRRRWLAAQLHYFSKDILQATWHLISNGNVDYFDKAIQFIQPPRIMLMGLLFFFLVISVFVGPLHITIIWFALLLACLIALLMAVPRHYFNLKTLKALWTLPSALGLMFISLLKIRGANKKFIHTEHISTKKDLNN